MTGKKTRYPLQKGHFTLWKGHFSTYVFITHIKQVEFNFRINITLSVITQDSDVNIIL